MREGVTGLLHDKTRKPGLPPLPSELVDRVVELTLAEPPGEATHWTGRAMAAASGISLRSVQRIWAAHGLQPHRVRHFTLSHDPAFAAKLRDVVGPYLDLPAHSLVLSVDEKPQIQSLPLARTGALARTQPGLPMKKGRAGTMTHDYIRNSLPRAKAGGTTTLFAALNVLDGTVIGQCMARHRHQEFIRFLNRIEAAVPAGKLIHAILDNYAVHKHPKVRAWLARHPRWTFHFTPTSCSWANAVEGFFATLTRRRLQRGVFHSLVDLQAAINRYLGEHNRKPKPFVWTADPDRIIEKVNRGNQAIASDHWGDTEIGRGWRRASGRGKQQRPRLRLEKIVDGDPINKIDDLGSRVLEYDLFRGWTAIDSSTKSNMTATACTRNSSVAQLTSDPHRAQLDA